MHKRHFYGSKARTLTTVSEVYIFRPILENFKEKICLKYGLVYFRVETQPPSKLVTRLLYQITQSRRLVMQDRLKIRKFILCAKRTHTPRIPGSIPSVNNPFWLFLITRCLDDQVFVINSVYELP